jgi:hypothetical protein
MAANLPNSFTCLPQENQEAVMPWIREAEIEQGKPAPAAIISVMSINPKAMDAV